MLDAGVAQCSGDGVEGAVAGEVLDPDMTSWTWRLSGRK